MSSPPHSAAPQALGYLYQSQWPLLELLRGAADRPDKAITIEHHDDVVWEQDGTPQELLQLKHHVDSQRTLGDRDPDWWRTIRAWMDAGDPGDPHGPMLTMVTTSTAVAGTAAAVLRPDAYSSNAALSLLESAAQASTEQAFASTRRAFLDLSEARRRVFVGRMRVLDASPSIGNLDKYIRHELWHTLPRGHEDTFMALLWTWWYQRVIDMLQRRLSGVKATDLAIFIDDLRDRFTRDNLPTLVSFSGLDAPTLEAEHADMPFVHQMHWVRAPSKILQTAIIDYYMAYSQQTRWLEDDLIGWQEIEEFERRLRDEWEREFAWETDGIADADEVTKQEAGRRLLRNALEKSLRVRERYDEPFFSRGKHHELANRVDSERSIGWHPEFKRKLSELFLAGAV